jgi:hypothetical protein
LLLACGLCNYWSKVAVTDTENHGAYLYAHPGRYKDLNLSEPFSPEDYIKALEACEKSYEAGNQYFMAYPVSREQFEKRTPNKPYRPQ